MNCSLKITHRTLISNINIVGNSWIYVALYNTRIQIYITPKLKRQAPTLYNDLVFNVLSEIYGRLIDVAFICVHLYSGSPGFVCLLIDMCVEMDVIQRIDTSIPTISINKHTNSYGIQTNDVQ